MKTNQIKPIVAAWLLASLGVFSCNRGESRRATVNTNADESPLAVSIAIPARDGFKANRTIHYVDKTSEFPVVVSNISDTPQRIWQEWNSWGWYGLTFEFRDDAANQWVARKKRVGFTKNIPACWILAPQESLVQLQAKSL